MPRVVRESYWETYTIETVEFDRIQKDGSPDGGGFAFHLKDGELKDWPLSDAGLVNLLRCVVPDAVAYAWDWNDDSESFEQGWTATKGKIKKYTDQYKWPKIIQCCENGQVELENFTNTCGSCGADYNSSGQLLAPRHMWGEETGEHWSEIY
tara:strand:- start:807 stop:1262 length:456 start_codon:yes stop_codon:yes gene_type:complete